MEDVADVKSAPLPVPVRDGGRRGFPGGSVRRDGGGERGPSIARVMVLRNFWPYFVGNLLSNSGTWFQSIAQVLLVYRLTHSPFWVGVVNFSQFAAVILLAPVAGNAADRFDRRRLIIAAQVSAALLAASLAAITAAGRVSPPIVIAVALALGATTAVTTPAMQAVVTTLVERSQMPAAFALTSVTFNLSRAIGPVAAVFVIARYDIATAFAFNSVSYLALVVGICLVTPRVRQEIPAERPRLRDSLRMVRAERALLAPLVIVGLVSLSSDPVNTLTPAFSTELFGRPDTFTGLLVGAFGAGAVVAAFSIPRRRAPSYAGLVVTLGLQAGGMAGFALATTEAVALGGLFVGGFGFLASVSAATSMLQLAVEESHRGRVSALWSLSFHGSRPPGSLVDGATASLVGLRAAGLVMVLPALAGCLGLALALRRRGEGQGRAGQVEPRTTSSGSNSTVTGSSDGS